MDEKDTTIDISNLSLEECIQLKEQLIRKIEYTPAQLYLEEHFFFMKKNRKGNYYKRVMERLADIMTELFKIGIYDEDSLHFAMKKVAFKTDHSGKIVNLRNNLVCFYNEAIPMEYKNNVFSYKRNKKTAESFDENVKNCILMVAKEYRNHRMGFTDSPKGK